MPTLSDPRAEADGLSLVRQWEIVESETTRKQAIRTPRNLVESADPVAALADVCVIGQSKPCGEREYLALCPAALPANHVCQFRIGIPQLTKNGLRPIEIFERVVWIPKQAVCRTALEPQPWIIRL